MLSFFQTVGAGAAYLKRYMAKGKIYAGVVIAVAICVVGATAFFFYALSQVGETLGDFTITQGKAGEFTIGAGKKVLLSQRGVQFFAAQPGACSTGWVSPATVNAKQTACLLRSNEWAASSKGTIAMCPHNTDVNTTLFFANNYLTKINVHCTRPE